MSTDLGAGPAPDGLSDDVHAFEQLARSRRSVRGFLPRPVPRALLDRIFELAQRAPSNCNVQPWLVHVASGQTLETLRRALMEAAASGSAPDSDFPGHLTYPGLYRDRQVDAARQLYGAMGIERSDIAARNRALLRNFEFFGAPHAAFLFVPDWAFPREIADCGMYAQTLMLALKAHGIDSCPQAALSQYATIVRAILGVDAGARLLFGISFGYEDESAPANRTRVDRQPLDATTRFHD
ncbi:MAG: nitroreductase family protein [Sphingobium sp.]